MRLFISALMFLLAMPWLAYAAPTAPKVKVENAWAMPSMGTMRSSAAYLTLTNEGASPLVLRAAASPAAEMVELHANMVEDDIIRMRSVLPLMLAPGESLAMKPGAHHVMLMGLKAPLALGDTLPVTFEFEGHESIKVDIPVTGRQDVPAAVNQPAPQED